MVTIEPSQTLPAEDSAMQPFAANYAEGRRRFLDACRRGGLTPDSRIHPGLAGPSGEPLAIDVVRVGPPDAENVLLSISGTHGVEAYAGSAVQCEWLEQVRLPLPHRTAVVLVHGLNPWGWAYDSQLNEDAADLNRNFVDFGRVAPADNTIDRSIAEALQVQRLEWAEVVSALARLQGLADQIGRARLATALARGQYSVSAGPKFGGHGPAWSNLELRSILDTQLAHARRLFVVDWHTGLGDWSDTFELCFSPPGSAAWEATARAWGKDRVRRGQQGWGMGSVSSPHAMVESGLAECAIVDRFPALPIAGGTVEFGTWPLHDILAGLVIDGWLARHPADPSAARWRAQVRTLFSPRESTWEATVARRGLALFDASLASLAAWTS